MLEKNLRIRTLFFSRDHHHGLLQTRDVIKRHPLDPVGKISPIVILAVQVASAAPVEPPASATPFRRGAVYCKKFFVSCFN